MANHYRSVLASGGGAPTGNAQPAEVLSGKTFENSNGPQTGTMPNNGAVSGTATPSQPYTIPAGYHNGSGVVTSSGIDIPTNTAYRFPDSITPTSVEVINISSGSASISKGTIIANVDNYDQAYFATDGVGMHGTNDFATFTPISPSSARTYNISSYKYVVFYSGTGSNPLTLT